jgi:stage III sporulation protein AG
MDWKAMKLKLNLKSGKNKWLVMLAVGLIFLILAFPFGSEKKEDLEESSDSVSLQREETETADDAVSYERFLEQRLEDILSHVDGVGQVEVMIVLKSSEEKVWRVDRDTSYSITQETDQNGGSRRVESQAVTENTILSGQTGKEEPLLAKEMKPEISGVIISAEGGKSPQVQAEISAAVEALFDVPSHKIKVLKRIE